MIKRILALLLCLTPMTAVFAEEKISSHEYYNEINELFQDQYWEDLIETAQEFLKEYPDSPFAGEVYYYIGVSYYYLEDFEFSNDYLTEYLKKSKSPKYFEETMYRKFLIAEHFRFGAKKRIFKWQKVPVYLSCLEDAIDIYDEIVNVYPYHELAAKSLFGKACIQEEFDEYKESIDTFQLLIRRFPKHELAIESFIAIGEVYLTQCEAEHLDPDILQRSENNYRKFKRAFPGEERLQEAYETLGDLKEVFAENLYDTGKFYERTKKKNAAIIYYSKAISKFPETKAATLSEKRLKVLKPDDENT